MAHVIKWPACPELDLPSFELEVPDDANGRIEIYKCPASEEAPDGYFFALNTSGNDSCHIEPGCFVNDVLFLANIRVNKPGRDDDEGTEGSDGKASVVMLHPAIKLDMEALNPAEDK